MYTQHFGLHEAPFGITPNPAFFYSGNTRGEILSALLYAVTHGEGIVKVTGEVGCGKTMLCRMLEARLPAGVDVLYLVNPTLCPQEVLHAIAAELGLETGGRRSDEVVRALQAELIARHAAGRRVVLLVEEAQAMPLETLEEIRLLTNLETANSKLLQIVLFGQPELDEHLSLPHMRQLRERITHSFDVPPMPRDQIPFFLSHRLLAAGYRGPELFSQGAVRLIARASRGIVRRINVLADKALMAAFADDLPFVNSTHVRLAIEDSRYSCAAVPGNRSMIVFDRFLATCFRRRSP
ncbi:AAA family ATPase [Massilia sp. SR12]